MNQIHLINFAASLSNIKAKVLYENPIKMFAYLGNIATRLGLTIPDTALSVEAVFDTVATALLLPDGDRTMAETIVFEMCQRVQAQPVMENISLYWAAWAFRRLIQDKAPYDVVFTSPRAVDVYLNIDPNGQAINGVPLLAILFLSGLDLSRLFKNRFEVKLETIYPELFPFPPSNFYRVDEKVLTIMAQRSNTRDFAEMQRFAQLLWENMSS